MICGPGLPPSYGKEGETKFGFTIRQRVKVIDKTDHFFNWGGYVRAFNDTLVAVELNEPPAGHRPNGQWFRPEELASVSA